MTSAKPRSETSDEAVLRATGKSCDDWFAILDAAGARELAHREIAVYLREQENVSPWWSQEVTVQYERARGLREKHQTLSGYQVSVSKTIAVPLDALYAACADDKARSSWLGEALADREEGNAVKVGSRNVGRGREQRRHLLLRKRSGKEPGDRPALEAGWPGGSRRDADLLEGSPGTAGWRPGGWSSVSAGGALLRWQVVLDYLSDMLTLHAISPFDVAGLLMRRSL